MHSRYGQERDPLVKVPFGLGQSPGPGAAERCLKCGFGNVPVTEEVVTTFLLPMLDTDLQTGIGADIVNLFNPGGPLPGVCSIDSTFLINGILQTDLYCTGIGIHVFVEPLTFTALGNGWGPGGALPPPGSAPAPSPDDFTLNDLNNGALGTAAEVGTSTTPYITPAALSWGADAWDAGWNYINAYQLQFRTNQRELMLNEMLADVSYFASFGDAFAAGTSEVAVIGYASLVNERYRALGSASIFLPANFRRYGSIGTSPASSFGVFHSTRDFDFAPVTHGGIKYQGTSCRGQMYRQIEKPCFFERGIPIGPQFVVTDPCHQARFLAAMSITNATGSQNLQPDVNVSGFTYTGTNVMLEQTLDLASPSNIPQQQTVERQVYKGGIFKVGVKLKGWEMPGAWKSWCQKNMPAILAGSSASPTAAST
jgi:hypothetical protein